MSNLSSALQAKERLNMSTVELPSLSSGGSWVEGLDPTDTDGSDLASLQDASCELCSAGSDEETEFSSEQESTEESEIESDLEDLNESFEYFEDAGDEATRQETESSTTCPARRMPAVDAAVFSTALYPDSALTVFQSYLLVFQYTVRHSLTSKAFAELLQFLAVHTPPGARIPKSVHMLKRFFLEAFPQAKSNTHLYCSVCQRSLPTMDSKCTGNGFSGGSPAEFITIPLGPQIKHHGRYVIKLLC